MKTVQKMSCLLVLAMLFAVADVSAMTEVEKKKEVANTFPVSLSDNLLVDNRYGNVTITHWNRNEVSIRVEIEASAGSEKRVQEILDRINVEIKKSGSTVSSVTSLASGGVSTRNNERFKISCYVQMPSKLSQRIINKYGNIIFPGENDGKINVEVGYGNVEGGNFSAALEIDCKYGNARIGNIADGEFDFSYSNLNMENGNLVELDIKYGNLVAARVQSLEMNMKYGNATLDYVGSRLQVPELSYSNLKVRELSAGFSRAELSARYGGVDIRIADKAAFELKADNLRYGSASLTGFTNINRNEMEKGSYRGTVNGGGKTINFNGNSYSNIKVHAIK